jgi:hypothetical protein
VDHEQVLTAMNFAAAVGKLKQSLDREDGATLDAADVKALVWGLQTLRRGSDDASRAAADRRRAAAGGR